MYDLREDRGIHLFVTVDLDYDFRAAVKCKAVATHHRATNPEVYFVAYHDYAGVVAIFADENSGTVGTCVVDGDDEEDFWTDSRNDFKYMLLRFVTWQNNGDFSCHFWLSKWRSAYYIWAHCWRLVTRPGEARNLRELKFSLRE